MQINHNRIWMLLERMLLWVVIVLSIVTWTLLVTGCGTRPPIVHEIDSNRQVITVHKGIPFTPPTDGKFVPEARFSEMLDVYIRVSHDAY